MKIYVRVKPSSKKAGIEKKGDTYIVRVKSPPVEGKANKELVEILSDYFGVPKSSIRIVRGMSGRNKVVEISE